MISEVGKYYEIKNGKVKKWIGFEIRWIGWEKSPP